LPEPIDQQRIAEALVEQARAAAWSWSGPVATGLTKTVLEPLEAEMGEHLGHDKHDPVGRNRSNDHSQQRRNTPNP
jgi:putative transposase